MKTTGRPATDRTHAATAIIDDSPAGGAFLSVKICPDDQQAAALWDESVLECAMVRDLVLASGGLPAEPQGSFFVARFTAVQSAALAARRLQWALQGYSDSGMTQPALAIVIQAGEDLARTGFDNRALDEAEGGRILVAEAAAKALEEVPAFVLKSSQERGKVGWRDLAWRAPDSRTTRDSDEETLARFIEQTGRFVSPATDATGPEAATGALAQPGYQVQTYAGDDAPTRSKKMLWIGLGSAAAALGVAAFLYLQAGNRENTASVPAAQTSSQSPANPAEQPQPSTVSVAPASNVNPPSATSAQKPQPPLTRAQKREEKRKAKEQAQAAANAAQPATDSQPSQPETRRQDQPARVTGSCQYAPDQISGLISLAENSRARRQYKDAQRKLQAVLNCEPGNARAREELELVRQAEAAESGNSDQ